MSEYTTQVGMDVHARSVSCKALRPDTGECWAKTFSGEGHEHELLEWAKKLPGPVRCAYESGCTGFWLSRFLERGGIACEVMVLITSILLRRSTCRCYTVPRLADTCQCGNR